MQYQTITIPDGFQKLARNYIAARRREIAGTLKLAPDQCLSDRDLNDWRVFGHNMKGTAVAFGFPELTPLGAKIETAAKAANRAQLAEVVREINKYLEYARQSLS